MTERGFLINDNLRASRLSVRLLFGFSICLGLAPLAPASNDFNPDSQIGFFLQATDTAVTLPVPDAHQTMSIGDRAPLLQRNLTHYIISVDDELGEPTVCAMPRFTQHGQPTAWITKQYDVVFATYVRSEPGELTLMPHETFKLVKETPGQYIIELNRYGHRSEYSVSRHQSGLKITAQMPTQLIEPEPIPAEPQLVATPKPDIPYVPVSIPDPETHYLPKQPRITRRHVASSRIDEGTAVALVIPPAPPEPVQEQPAPQPPAPQVAPTHPVAELAATTTLPDLPPANGELPVSSSSSTSSSPQVNEVLTEGSLAGGEILTEAAPQPAPVAEVATGPAPVPAQVADMAPAPQPAPIAAPPVVGFLDRHALSLEILLIVALAEFVIIILQHRKTGEPHPGPQVEAFTTTSESITTDAFHNLAMHETGTLNGALDGITLGEIIQFLNGANESGCLTVVDSEMGHTGKCYLREGEIIHAAFCSQTGATAFQRMMNCKKGSFAFLRDTKAAPEITIQQSTMGLLMNTLKDQDEGTL